MKFLDVCMDSFLVLASYILPWQKRRIGWRGLFGVPIDRGRLPQNSRTSFPQPRENDVDTLRKNKIF